MDNRFTLACVKIGIYFTLTLFPYLAPGTFSNLESYTIYYFSLFFIIVIENKFSKNNKIRKKNDEHKK